MGGRVVCVRERGSGRERADLVGGTKPPLSPGQRHLRLVHRSKREIFPPSLEEPQLCSVCCYTVALSFKCRVTWSKLANRYILREKIFLGFGAVLFSVAIILI